MKNGVIATFLIGIIGLSEVFGQGRELHYQNDTARLTGYFVPSSAKAEKKIPGIVIIHAWMGITEHERSSAQKLGKLGYNVLAADIYGEKIRPSGPKDAAALSGSYKKNYKIFQARIRSAVEALIKQGTDPENIIIIGYCFGGTGAIEAARGGLPVKAIVSFHGGLGKDSLRANSLIKSRVLILHGADDPFVPESDIKKFQQEMRDGKADWQMNYYSDAVHAFTDPAAGNDKSKGAAYNQVAEERSWEALLLFLEELKEKAKTNK